jgi:hypothetical protein
VPQGLEQPDFTVLRAGRGYEVRRYAPFIVADAPVSSGGGPASGGGFNELAGYIFGGNEAKESLEMTTPVFTQPVDGGSQMSFVMERRFGDVEKLPQPLDGRIRRRRVEGRYVAAARFSGFAFDWEVAAEERALRAALLRDGLEPALDFRLARYNEPTLPPFLRRNEVLIDLPEFEWP